MFLWIVCELNASGSAAIYFCMRQCTAAIGYAEGRLPSCCRRTLRATDSRLRGGAGKHVVVCTATASGKSLCYNLPIMEALAQDRKATALYMFPTKALAQDQLRALRELCDWTFGKQAPFVDIYDGDTPKASIQASKKRWPECPTSAQLCRSPICMCRGVPQAWLVCSVNRSGA